MILEFIVQMILLHLCITSYRTIVINVDMILRCVEKQVDIVVIIH